jgi:Flp pilus assembly protein TadB
MMLLAALSGALIVAGVLGLIYGLTPRPVAPARPARTRGAQPWSKVRTVALAGLAAGAVVALVTGWLVAIILVPAVSVMVFRVVKGRAKNRIERLNALADFARGLGGVLTAGRGLEQAILHAARSAPTALAPEIGRLAARVRANVATGTALRLFADELDDATGDLFVATLLLAAERRGPGVASAMSGLAESIDADVRARRQVETEQQKARTAARMITVISGLLLGGLFLAGSYVEPYRTPLGQVLLIVLMGMYLVALVWMGRISAAKPLPRFIGAGSRQPGGGR